MMVMETYMITLLMLIIVTHLITLVMLMETYLITLVMLMMRIVTHVGS